MILAMVNLLFGCRHRRTTLPITPVHKPGTPSEDTYIACLGCGKRWHYDLTMMRIGKPIPLSMQSSSTDFQPSNK